jgi:hypothetical protein
MMIVMCDEKAEPAPEPLPFLQTTTLVPIMFLLGSEIRG